MKMLLWLFYAEACFIGGILLRKNFEFNLLL